MKLLNGNNMKRLFYILSIAFLLVNCKNQSKERNTEVQELEEIKIEWTKEQKNEFIQNCNVFLENDGVDGTVNYCTCLLEATMNAHPDPETAMELEQNDIVSLFEESGCLDDYLMVKIEDPWTEEVSMAFLDSCKKSRVEMGDSDEVANEYCACSLAKIKELIPQPQYLLQLTTDEWNAIKKSCE